MRLVPADGRNEFIFFVVITLTFTGDSVTNSSLSVPVTIISFNPFISSSSKITKVSKSESLFIKEIFFETWPIYETNIYLCFDKLTSNSK